jgi:chromosome segregation ATPase
MPPEEKHKINVWLLESLWKQVEVLGYDSTTKATIAAFEALVSQNTIGSNKEALGSSKEVLGSLREVEEYKQDITRYEENIKVLNAEIAKLTEILSNSPDPADLAQARARYEEIEKHNGTLIKDLDKAERDKEDLKITYNKLQDTYNNYMAQMQTLIKQKVVEASGAKKPWWRFW